MGDRWSMPTQQSLPWIRNYPDMEVRRAILDLNEDRLFDEKDVEKFLTEFDTANGAKDYSRYDLNGDGLTGGTGTRLSTSTWIIPPPTPVSPRLLKATV